MPKACQFLLNMGFFVGEMNIFMPKKHFFLVLKLFITRVTNKKKLKFLCYTILWGIKH